MTADGSIVDLWHNDKVPFRSVTRYEELFFPWSGGGEEDSAKGLQQDHPGVIVPILSNLERMEDIADPFSV